MIFSYKPVLKNKHEPILYYKYIKNLLGSTSNRFIILNTAKGYARNKPAIALTSAIVNGSSKASVTASSPP